MIYDEGFAVEFDKISFFAFLKYSVDVVNETKQEKSYCHSTCVGWFTDRNTQWGCYKAFKKGELDEPTFTKTDDGSDSGVVEPNFSEVSFLSSQFSLKVPSNFKDHIFLAEKLNSMGNMWEAKVYPFFKELDIKGLNSLAGREKKEIPTEKSFSFTPTDLPRHFDWRSMVNPAGHQGSCGSCYVFSTTRMLEARLKIKYNKDFNISIQHTLDCNFYNQGCDGGYPYLVLKYAREFGLVPEECAPYTVFV